MKNHPTENTPKLSSRDIRARFLAFFAKRGHAIVPSASLIPENDPSVLFNTAGMQPLVPYLLGQKHPQGKRLANAQKCVRTVDIDDIGDNTHATFFEMLGNWSLGDYFKKEAIQWSYEFLTSPTEGLGLNPARLYITVFEGDEVASKDTEAAKLWQAVGIPAHRIYYLPAKNNWWAAGDNGPCGPDSEMFYDVTPGEGLGDLTHEQFLAADERRDVVEIWNDVFMAYEKKNGVIVGSLAQQNIDTGSGLERVTMVVQGVNNIYDTDLLASTYATAQRLANEPQQRAARIVADHIRTASFLIAAGVRPSNTDQGYILRRLIRRAVRQAHVLGHQPGSLVIVAETVIENYKDIYEEIAREASTIRHEIQKEEERFRTTLAEGLKRFGQGEDPFVLFTTYGFPIELTRELAAERGRTIDEEAFQHKMAEHQTLSRAGASQKFKGGLADTGEASVRYHTATHLLHQALRQVLGDTVQQKGSNITAERLRFDFTHPAKLTDEQKQQVERIVNQKIAEALPVQVVELPKEQAIATGALHFFGDKYGDKVTVYYIGSDLDHAYSKEFCGGPHVKNTRELGTFVIQKEEAVSAGVRRIKAILTQPPSSPTPSTP
jgi:alanyl-tRNA synthetase